MKRGLIAGIGFLLFFSLHAQNIQEMTYTDNNKIMDAFGFSNPICNKEVLVNNWKNFIKKQNGKVKGGVINKATGTNIRFSPEGEAWNGYFAYSFNEDKTMTVFTSFQNMQGDFLTAESPKEELQPAMVILEKFRLSTIKSCYSDDLDNAKNYKLSLSKEKIRNLDNIKFLEGFIKKDSQRVEVTNVENLSDKELEKLNKIKTRIESNKSEIQKLTQRNDSLDEELKAQQLVISDFQRKVEELNELNNETTTSPLNNTDEENISDKKEDGEQENENSQEEEYPKKMFDK